MQRVALWSSLRTRLTVISLIAVVVILVLANQALTSLFRTHVTEQFRDDLTGRLDHLTGRLVVNPATRRIELNSVPTDARLQTPYSGWYWQVQADQIDGVLLRSRSLWDLEMSLPKDVLQPGVVQAHEIAGPQSQRLLAVERVVRMEDAALEKPVLVRVSVGADLSTIDAAVVQFHRTTVTYLSLLGALLIVLLIVQLWFGLAPLRYLSRALFRLRHGEESRITGRFPAEVHPLVEGFNAVLESNEQMFERARRQSGNLAHAIKTPLAVLTGAAADSNNSAQELRRVIIEQVDQVNRQVGWHLARARASASIAVPGRTARVREAVHGLVGVMKSAHAEKSLHFDVSVQPADLKFAGEMHDLQEIIGNLLDNASKWARHKVQLQAHRIDGQIEILIDDDGLGIAEHMRTEVMRHGVRADELKPGTGLGLGIVADLVDLYRGEIQLGSSALGGLNVRLRLPAAQD